MSDKSDYISCSPQSVGYLNKMESISITLPSSRPQEIQHKNSIFVRKVHNIESHLLHSLSPPLCFSLSFSAPPKCGFSLASYNIYPIDRKRTTTMAFNPAFETKRKVSAVAESVEKEVSLFSESQNSWVVFNPQDLIPYDILSFSTSNPLTSSDEEVEENEVDTNEVDEHEVDELVEAAITAQISARIRSQLNKDNLNVVHDEPHENDDLIEDLHLSLSNRINEWRNTTDTSVLDNVASWDLDADLVHQMLDTSILQQVPAFYGDRFFDNMSKSDYARFKTTSARLKRSLTRKGFESTDPDFLTRLFSLLQWQSLLRGSGSGSLVSDYIMNTRSRVHFRRPDFTPEFSDTATSSSLVMCGGNSWNDV